VDIVQEGTELKPPTLHLGYKTLIILAAGRAGGAPDITSRPHCPGRALSAVSGVVSSGVLIESFIRQIRIPLQQAKCRGMGGADIMCRAALYARSTEGSRVVFATVFSLTLYS